MFRWFQHPVHRLIGDLNLHDRVPVDIGRLTQQFEYYELPLVKVQGFAVANAIVVNEALDYEEKRAVIAHEAAHIILGHVRNREKILKLSIPNIADEVEDEAWQYAGQMLVCQRVLKRAWAISQSIKFVSFLFQVPEFVIRTRLRDLRLE